MSDVHPISKQCSKCGLIKSADCFGKKGGGKFGLRAACKQCRKAEAKEYYSRPEVKEWHSKQWSRMSSEQKQRAKAKHRENHLKRKFGLSLAQYSELLKNQNELCAICLKSLGENLRYIHVDHCHSSGKVRNILCQKCNAALGMVDDSVQILERAIAYLKKHGKSA